MCCTAKQWARAQFVFLPATLARCISEDLAVGYFLQVEGVSNLPDIFRPEVKALGHTCTIFLFYAERSFDLLFAVMYDVHLPCVYICVIHIYLVG